MDEFYLPEDIVEWIGLKKSEYLSRLIENADPKDVPFEEYGNYEDLIPATITHPDWSTEKIEDSYKVRTYCRSLSNTEILQQVVIGAVIEDQGKNDVFVPIISFVTKFDNLIKLFGEGKMQRPLLN